MMRKKLIFLASFVLVLGLFPSGVTNAADPGLVGWWRLDESSGTTARDSSGNGNNGQLNGNTQWQPGNGQVRGALEFDGATGHVTIPFSESLRVLNEGDFTIAAWFKTDEIPSENKEVFQQGDGNGTGRTWLYLSSANEIRSFLGGSSVLSEVAVEAGTWYHTAVAITEGGAIDTIRLYVNGRLVDVPPGQAGMESSEGTYYIGCHKELTNFWDGLIDDVRLYKRALTQQDLPQVMMGVDPALASDPIPTDTATDVSRDVVLSWTAGSFTAPTNGHIVYFSNSFGDVNDGVNGVTQSAASYDPRRLEFDTTYYWRVDEVNAPPDSTVFRGDVWSFTTEPAGYPIDGANITATASSSGQVNLGPENTINGSGLDENDHHSTVADDMWLSGNEMSGAWIQYEFDKPYKLHEMWVWNSNQSFEGLFGFGMKDVIVEYSTDGTNWTALADVPQFAKAPGTSKYAHDTTVDFGGAVAKFVKLTASSNWGGMLPQYGLSEVRFYYIPVSARKPSPESGATDMVPAAALSWRAGREAATHNVYVSPDEQAVIDSTAPVVSVTEASYSLDLDLAATYYWRIDEVNELEVTTNWPGDVWNFSTSEYLVVDDFESYNDIDPPDSKSNRIFESWSDGYDVATNGALVGNDFPPYLETATIHGGSQSVPVFYSNTGGASYSEAARTFAPAQDWTKYGIQSLQVWFYGTAGNTGQLYVKINGVKVPYGGDAANLAVESWQPWDIDLAMVGVNLASITSLAIGIDGNAAAGTLYFDDIRLY